MPREVGEGFGRAAYSISAYLNACHEALDRLLFVRIAQVNHRYGRLNAIKVGSIPAWFQDRANNAAIIAYAA